MASTQEVVSNTLVSTTPLNLWVHGGVVGVGALVALVSFGFLIPLDSVPAVTGVSIIMAVAYSISICLWLIVISYFRANKESLIWLNTNLLFLVILPATIGATAMNVTAVQNTRNLLAGQITA